MTRTVLLAALALAVPRAAAADDAKPAAPATIEGEIREIVVEKNSKTTDDTVIYIADIDKGDDWNAEAEAEVEANLETSGLFKEVATRVEPHEKGGLRLIITARDKHSWIVAPTYYDQPTNRAIGAGFGENNLFGENKKLLLYGQVAFPGDSFFIGAYIDPSIRGTPFMWQFDVLAKKERVLEYQAPTEFVHRGSDELQKVRQSKLNYLNSGVKLGVKILRRLDLQARIRAAYVSYDDDVEALGPALDDLTELGVPADSTIIPKPGAEGWDVSTEFIAKFDNRANFYGVSEGTKLSASYENARPGLGSDFDYWYATFSGEKAIRLGETGNLVLKGMFGYGEDLPFQQEYTSGGTSLRGYENRQFRGDRKAAGNAELSVQLFNIKGFALRGLTFFDSSYTAFYDNDETDTFRNYLPNAGEHGLAPFKNSVGIGTRVSIRQIVLPLLGLDLGYGLESGGVEVYLAIGLTDV